MGQSLLELLRSSSAIDCDTLDAEATKNFGPFVDCTSNQAIVYGELSQKDAKGCLKHQRLLLDSLAFANSNLTLFPGVDVVELAVEIVTVKLAHLVAPNITGYVHVQVNPRYCYDKDKLMKNAKRLVVLSGMLNPDRKLQNICVKILATWEGLQACAGLSDQGIMSLATGIVSLQQAALASEVGCAYIGCYVNELRVHFDKSFVDEDRLMALPGLVQKMYDESGSKTRITTASLTMVTEVMQLAGADHITLSPPLFSELAITPAYSWNKGDIGIKFKESRSGGNVRVQKCEDEAHWRFAFSREQDGEREAKLIRAINVFCNRQADLEFLVRQHIG